MAVYCGCYGKNEVEFVGCTFATYELNMAYDSYWYAVYWDSEKKEFRRVEYDTTAAYSNGWAKVDVTEDVAREAYRYIKKKVADAFDAAGNENIAKKVKTGDNVVVTRGRKVPKGTTGKVFWIGSRYNNYSRMDEDRVGIDTDDGRVFLPLEYVEPVNWRERLLSGKERKKRIREETIGRLRFASHGYEHFLKYL